MQLPKLLEGLTINLVNINHNDNRKIEILSGEKNKGTFILAGSKKIKANNSVGKKLTSGRKDKAN